MNHCETSSRVTPLSISAAGCSDKGHVRENNEDAIALCDPPDPLRAEQLGTLYLLADGAGGHAAGEVASSIAVETIPALYYDQAAPDESVENPTQWQHHSQSPFNTADTACMRLQQAFLAAHARIRQLADLRCEYAGMVFGVYSQRHRSLWW